MRSVKPIAALLLASMTMSLFICGCSKQAGTSRKNRDNDEDTDKTKAVEVELPENEIIAVTGYRNEAWGHQSSMILVCSDGSVYYSREEFSGYTQYFNDGLTREERLALLEKYTKPAAVIDIDDIKKIYSYMLKIDTDAKFEYSDEYAYDAGTNYTEVNIKGKWIMTSESGDRNGTLDDRYAKKADDLITRSISSFGGLKSANVYSGADTFIDTFECPGSDVQPGKMIITNLDQLRQFERDTGIDLRNNDCFEYFGDKEYDAFGHMCIAVEIYSYHVRYKPVEADAFIVSEDYVGFASMDDYVDMTNNQAPAKCYCHVVQLPNYNDSALEDYKMFLE